MYEVVQENGGYYYRKTHKHLIIGIILSIALLFSVTINGIQGCKLHSANTTVRQLTELVGRYREAESTASANIEQLYDGVERSKEILSSQANSIGELRTNLQKLREEYINMAELVDRLRSSSDSRDSDIDSSL